MKNESIKILGVVDEDPFDYRTWSGISYYLFSAMKKRDCLYAAIPAQPSEMARFVAKCRNFHPDIKKWKFKYHLSVDYFQQMTQAALHKIEQMKSSDYDAILQIGAWYDLTRRSGKKTVSYHDGNLHALLKSPYGFPRIHQRYIQRALNYEKTLYEKMDLVFPMSKWLAGSFISDFGVDPGKVVPVGAGVNLPYVKEVKNKSYDQPNILFVGKNFERKGGNHLLEAFKMVRKEVKNASLTVVGPQLKQIPDGVRCLGVVSKNTREGIESLLNEYMSATLFVMPSLYEPFGVVFAEAMAHKLPCVGTNICAMPEIIDDGVTGYIVPVGESAQLARRILDLLKEPAACRDMGEKGFIKYRENFTWDIVVSKMVEQIKGIA